MYAACERGEIPVTRIGRDLRFKREEIERWVNSQTQRPALVATLKAGG